MRILVVVDTYVPARISAALQMRDLAREMAAQGHEPTVVVPAPGQAEPWRIERQDGAPRCAERFHAPTPEPEAPGDLGDDAELDALSQSCFGGDAGACDDLYLQSPVDSAYEHYGATCGGRLALPSDGGCESQFGS